MSRQKGKYNMKLRSSKAACYIGAAIVLFLTPVLPAVATTYEKTQNTDTGIKVASYSANTEEVLGMKKQEHTRTRQ